MEPTEKLIESLGGWYKYLEPFIRSKEWDQIFAELKSRKGKIRTLPESSDVFTAFKKCSPDNLKVIICGISPYHTVTKEGIVVADGQALSCSKTKVLQPSLQMVYSDWENTYSDTIDVDMIHDPDLSYLSAQGVMLLNVGLTVQESKACSDNQLWMPFHKYLWEEVINKYFRGLGIVLMGTEAHKSEKYIQPMLHYIYKVSHPASAAYQGTQWSSEGVWKKLDKILEENYQTKIEWYQRKSSSGAPWIE